MGKGSTNSRAYWSEDRRKGEEKCQLGCLDRLSSPRRSATILTVLRGNVNATSLDGSRVGESEDGLVVSTVTEPHAVGVESSGESDDLVTHADTKDGLIPLVDGLPHNVSGLHAVLWVSGTVGKEETVELIADLVEIVVPGEDGDGSSTTSEGTEDVGLGTKVEEGNLDVSLGVEGVDLLGRHLVDKVLDGGIPVLGSIGSDLVSFSSSELGEGRSVVAEEGGDGASVDSGDSRDSMAIAPLVERLDSLVVRVALREVTDNDSGALHSVRLENDGRAIGLGDGRVVGDSVVADEGGGEDDELRAVGGVGHRLGVGGDGGGEDCLSKAGEGSTERLAGE